MSIVYVWCLNRVDHLLIWKKMVCYASYFFRSSIYWSFHWWRFLLELCYLYLCLKKRVINDLWTCTSTKFRPCCARCCDRWKVSFQHKVSDKFHHPACMLLTHMRFWTKHYGSFFSLYSSACEMQHMRRSLPIVVNGLSANNQMSIFTRFA